MVSPESKITEKTSFIIGLVGVIIALQPIKEDIKSINIDFGFADYSILTPLYFTFVLLLLSLYIYALDYVKYGFKIIYSQTYFKHLQYIANSLYFIAIISPIIYLTLWLFFKVYRMIPILNITFPYLDTLISISFIGIITGLSILAAWRQNEEHNQAEEEHLDESALNSMNEARQLVDERLWNLSIFEAYHSLELSISKKLIELGIDAKKIPIFRSIDILLKNGVLSIYEANKLNYIVKLRNEVAHSLIELSKEDASEVIETINGILPKLKTSTINYSLFEKEIFETLSGGMGLFPKHHLYLQKSRQGYDVKAEGPNDNNYLIKIILTRNRMIIYKFLDALKKFSSGTNIRYIIVVPKAERTIELKNDAAKVLYYDIEKHNFQNRDEIYKWIYGVEADKS